MRRKGMICSPGRRSQTPQTIYILNLQTIGINIGYVVFWKKNKNSLLASGLPTLKEAEGAPLHEVIKRYIEEEIMTGSWGPGTVLPAENDLALHFGVAVGTVRKALTNLTSEGVLMRRRKTGTVVTGWGPLQSLRYFFQYFRLQNNEGELVTSDTQILEFAGGSATKTEAEKLQLTPGAEVIRMHRLRTVAGIPAMHERLVLPAAPLEDFPSAEHIPSLLYQYLSQHYGIRVAAVRENITADLANEEDRRLLKLHDPHAVMVINEISFDQTAKPIILAEHRASTEHFSYINEIR